MTHRCPHGTPFWRWCKTCHRTRHARRVALHAGTVPGQPTATGPDGTRYRLVRGPDDSFAPKENGMDQPQYEYKTVIYDRAPVVKLIGMVSQHSPNDYAAGFRAAYAWLDKQHARESAAGWHLCALADLSAPPVGYWAATYSRPVLPSEGEPDD